MGALRRGHQWRHLLRRARLGRGRRDVGIRDGRIAAVGPGPAGGQRDTGDRRRGQVGDARLHRRAHPLRRRGRCSSRACASRCGTASPPAARQLLALERSTSDAEDAADLFSRVEAVPREARARRPRGQEDLDDARRNTSDARDLPLGPNVASLLGPLGRCARTRARTRARRPPRTSSRPRRDSADERRCSTRRSTPACSACQDGRTPGTSSTVTASGRAPCRRRSPPGSEYRRLARVLRKRGRILQGAPNINNEVERAASSSPAAGCSAVREAS